MTFSFTSVLFWLNEPTGLRGNRFIHVINVLENLHFKPFYHFSLIWSDISYNQITANDNNMYMNLKKSVNTIFTVFIMIVLKVSIPMNDNDDL